MNVRKEKTETMRRWRVLLLDTKKNNPNHYICIAIKDAFEQHPNTEIIVKADYGNALDRALKHQCNLFVAFDGEELDRGICSRLSMLCDVSVLWITEDPYEHAINLENAKYFDLVFTNDSGSADSYKKKGVHLPFAASTKFHFHEVCEESSGQFRYDLFFAGTAWPNRVDFINRLKSRLGTIKFKLALPSNPHIPAPDLDMAPSSFLWKTPNSEFARLANRSRTVLTLHRSFSSAGNPTAQTPGPRLFEVALAGGFQLIDMSLPEAGQYFEEGTHFAGFHTPEECIEKLQFYLAHPEQRIAIARSAQKCAQEKHLYSNRIDTLYSKIAELKKRKKNLKVRDPRPSILFVTHNVIGVQPYGGVEVYQHTLVSELRKHFRFFLYAADRSAVPLGSRYVLYDEHMHALETHAFDTDVSDAVLSCPDRERIFSQILLRHGIALVHFHHFISHTPSLPFITKALGIPSVASLNDYYAICRHFNLMGYQDRFCNVSTLPPISCDICLNAKDNYISGSQGTRRAFFGRSLEQINVLHANTEGVASQFKDIFPNLRSGNKFQIKGLPLPAENQNSKIIIEPAQEQINIAIVGNFTRIKGADVMVHAFNQMREDPVQFHIFGTVEEPYNTILQHLQIPNLTNHGEFQAGSIDNQLQTMTLSLHLSIWPETYCITLSEAWKAGLVPIVTDIGALGERVTHGVNGFKVGMDEPGSVVEIIRQLILQPERIQKARQNIKPDLYVTAEEHASWLKEVYENRISQFSTANLLSGKKAPESSLTLADCGVILNRNTWPIHNTSIHPSPINRSSTTTKQEALIKKAMAYRSIYGTKQMLARIMHELKMAVKNSFGFKLP